MTDKFKIGDLKRAEYNPRIMPDSEMQALKESIKTFGFVEPVVVNTNKTRYGVLVGGHQRTSAVEQLIAKGIVPTGVEPAEGGGYYIPAVLVDYTLDKEKLLNIGLNKISGKWDEDKLFPLIVELREHPNIPATGFREDEISRILDSTLPDEEEPEDEDGEPKEPQSKLGEIYELGPHRLICGDSTDPETYTKLLGGVQADMVWSDPPYNVAYKSESKKLDGQGNESIKNDDMSAADFKAFIDKAFAAIFQSVKVGGAVYICSGFRALKIMLDSIFACDFHFSSLLMWVKNNGSFGFNDYVSRHEEIIYGWKNGTHQFHGDGEYDVWEMPRKATAKYLHPTEKPDWLPMRAMRNSSKRNDIILDPFAGSGSVMAAAEKVGRRAYMIELDPKFCDVIRDRWARIEKQKAEQQVK